MPPTLPDKPFVLLEGDFAPSGGELYRKPLQLIRAEAIEQVEEALAGVDAALAAGHFVAGFLSYELGYALEPRLAPLIPAPRSHPLIWLGVFERPQGAPGLQRRPVRAPSSFAATIAPAAYRAGIEQILNYIRAGDIYQVNYTHALTFERPADPYSLYEALKLNQPVPFPALIDTGNHLILSHSPELFFRIEDGRITARPMKGTAPRARLLGEDLRAAAALHNDEKNRAENLMIVDLMRNDLSKIARTGTVRVPSLFRLETYRTLHTMTSSVEAELMPGTRASQIIKALFPCGSVTGAPKIRAMEIIRELETHPRGVYTGAIGVFRPDGSACFNVAIRTLTIPREGPASIGVGGGIVADSEAPSEADEARLKARFLSDLPQRAADQAPLTLIETLRWTPQNGYELLDEHLARLKDSAAYFKLPYSPAVAREVLEKSAGRFSDARRVRLTLAENGALAISDTLLGNPETLWRYVVSATRISSADPFRAHKTSRRALYDEELAQLKAETGCDEVLYLNEREELAEGGRSNLFIERGSRLRTPPISAGALPGVLRRHLIEEGRAEEAVLTLADLEGADAVYFGNSVRGLVRAMPAISVSKSGAFAR